MLSSFRAAADKFYMPCGWVHRLLTREAAIHDRLQYTSCADMPQTYALLLLSVHTQ